MLELGGNISQEGKLQVFNQAALTQWRIDNAGKEIVLSLKVKRKSRSNPQNAYYWGVVVPLITEAVNKLGNDFKPEETHEFLKARFNAKQIEIIDGHFIELPQSTSNLDTKEFMLFIENIQQFASMLLGLYIPSPNEQTTIDYTLTKSDDN